MNFIITTHATFEHIYEIDAPNENAAVEIVTRTDAQLDYHQRFIGEKVVHITLAHNSIPMTPDEFRALGCF